MNSTKRMGLGLRLALIFVCLVVIPAIMYSVFAILSTRSDTTEDVTIDYNLLEDKIRETSIRGVVSVEIQYTRGDKRYTAELLGAIINQSGLSFDVITVYGHPDFEDVSFSVTVHNGSSYPATLIKSSESKNLTLLSFIGEASDNLHRFPLTHSAPDDYGTLVGIGRSNTVKFGSASALRFNQSIGYVVFQHNIQINKVNQTGLVVDEENRLVGINVGSGQIVNNGKETNYAIPASSIRDFI